MRVAECCEGVGGRDVDGGEVRSACCAVGKSASDDLIIDAQALGGRVTGVCVLRVGLEAGFYWVRVFIQPVQQACGSEQPNVGELWRVDVGVYTVSTGRSSAR